MTELSELERKQRQLVDRTVRIRKETEAAR